MFNIIYISRRWYYSISAPLQSRLDCKHINFIFYIAIAFSMLGLGFSFLYPAILGSSVSIPCLVVAGASYGMGVGPVANVLMSALFPQKIKSLGLAISNTMHALVLFGLVKVGHIGRIVKSVILKYNHCRHSQFWSLYLG